MSDNDKYVIRAGETSHGKYETDLTIERAGWEWSALGVLGLPAGESEEVNTGETELIVLPLEGSCTVTLDDKTYELEGRESIWTGFTDYLYVPRNSTFTIKSDNGGRFALPAAKATVDLEPRYCPTDEVVTMVRGAGDCSRQVHNYSIGNELKPSHLLVTEVYTPGGNWSSYPPHKHDEHTEEERILEEIYYYEIRPAANGTEGMAIQRIYPSPGKQIDVCAEVHSRDMVIMPYGYHGPSIAAPGYDLYYLNVMAGPAEDAAWMVTFDPHFSWINDELNPEDVDPRLPLFPLGD